MHASTWKRILLYVTVWLGDCCLLAYDRRRVPRANYFREVASIGRVEYLRKALGEQSHAQLHFLIRGTNCRSGFASFALQNIAHTGSGFHLIIESEVAPSFSYECVCSIQIHASFTSSSVQLLLLLLLTTAAQAQVGNTKLFINCFLNLTSTCATENWRKHNSGKQPTFDCTLEPIERSGVKHSVGKVIPQSNLSRQERPS